MANLKFYKKASAPTGAVGEIWFDTTNKRIKLYEKDSWISYGAELTSLSSNTTNAVSITVGGVTKNIATSTMKSSLGLGSAAYKDASDFDAAGAATTAETNAKDYADSLFAWAEYE